MIKNKTIAVIVTCFNEESQIGQVLETMPEFVDRIIVIDDKSTDNTSKIIKNYILTLRKNIIKNHNFNI